MKQDRSGGQREDLRQRRTKKFLVNALLELMEERPFQELSVVDICDRAMVHRTTFYAHFEDKHDLLRYAVRVLEQEFEAVEAPEEGRDHRAYFLAVFRNALDFLGKHRKLYLSGLAGGGEEIRLLEDAVAERLLEAAGGMEPEWELTARFYAGGVLAMLRCWLSQDAPVGEDRLMACLEHLLPERG